MSKFRLNPGTPFKGDMFGGNAPEGSIRNNTNSNTHIPPHPPVLCSKVLADGKEDSWLEYVPADLDPESRPPLIISCHGGGAQAQMQFDETSWCYIAEQEGAVAVFPNAGGTRRSWLTADDAEQKPGERPSMLDVFTENPDGRASETAHHIQFLKALIQEMKAKYNIDEGRVYVQGMSMGDIMTMMFARVCGDLLAGIDSTAGPSPQVALFDDDGNIKGFKCPVPVYQSRGELDAIVVGPVAGKENTTRQDVNYVNRKFWLKVNECDTLPRLSILDVNNFAFYTGKKANVVYRDVKHRAHGQTLDDAYWAWNTLFKGTRRNPDGSITCLDTDYSARGDVDAAALCAGCGYAYINNTRVKLEAPAFIEPLSNFDFATRSLQEYKRELYVPVSFLTQYFDIPVDYAPDRRSAVLHCPEGDCEIAESSIATLWDGFLRSMFVPTILKDGVLFVAVRWFAEVIFGMHVTQCDDALYISDHHGEMSKDMAYLIRDILS
ncbi:MAG: hypothetical protein IKX47_09105 [Oscillospiraceae bacterium]|nr:hypothetical protein [Oscillospiraceae bacterium]